METINYKKGKNFIKAKVLWKLPQNKTVKRIAIFETEKGVFFTDLPALEQTCAETKTMNNIQTTCSEFWSISASLIQQERLGA